MSLTAIIALVAIAALILGALVHRAFSATAGSNAALAEVRKVETTVEQDVFNALNSVASRLTDTSGEQADIAKAQQSIARKAQMLALAVQTMQAHLVASQAPAITVAPAPVVAQS